MTFAMDLESSQSLARLLRSERVAFLAALLDGAPVASLVPYVVAHDFASFYIHVHQLTTHARALIQNPLVSLMIAEADATTKDPHFLARVAIRGDASEITPAASGYEQARADYVGRFQKAAVNFELAEFSLYRIRMRSAQFVRGFGSTFDLSADDFRRVADIT